jgi:hypothetical protein
VADPDELLSRMTAAQLSGWAAFAELEPFGPLRDDQRVAAMACAIVNSIPFRGRGAKALRPGDVFNSLSQPFKRQTTAQMAAFAHQTTLAMGGEVKTIKKDCDYGRKKRRLGNRDRRKSGTSSRRPK